MLLKRWDHGEGPAIKFVISCHGNKIIISNPLITQITLEWQRNLVNFVDMASHHISAVEKTG